MFEKLSSDCPKKRQRCHIVYSIFLVIVYKGSLLLNVNLILYFLERNQYLGQKEETGREREKKNRNRNSDTRSSIRDFHKAHSTGFGKQLPQWIETKCALCLDLRCPSEVKAKLSFLTMCDEGYLVYHFLLDKIVNRFYAELIQKLNARRIPRTTGQ